MTMRSPQPAVSGAAGRPKIRLARRLIFGIPLCAIAVIAAWLYYDAVVPPKRLRVELNSMVNACASRAMTEVREMRRRHDAVSAAELADSPFVPFVDSGAEMRMPESLSLGADISRHATTNDVLALAGRTPRLSLQVEDMAPYDPFVLGAFSADRGIRDRSRKRLGRREFSDFYRKVSGAPLSDPQFTRPVFFLHFTAFPSDPTGVKLPPSAFSIVFHTDSSAKRYRFYPMRLANVIPRPDKMLGAYSYAMHMKPQVDTAAGIIAAHHPGAHKDNLRILLLYHIVTHQNEMTDEDPFQDCAACRWAGCANREALEEAYAGYPPKEIGIGKFRIRVPFFAWNIAALLPRYAIDRQGLGPNQIIIGYARRAAGAPGLADRYAPFLSQVDVRSTRALVRAVLDPVKAVFVTALMYDYILTRLEQGPFADRAVRMPVDVAPYISDDAAGREYALLLLTQRLSLFPDFDACTPAFLTFRNPPLYAHMLVIGDIFGIRLHLPGLFYLKWVMPEQIVYATYWREESLPRPARATF